MTKTDKLIIRFIIDYYKKNQFYPNYSEIADSIGTVKSTIHTHIKRLESEGIIIRKDNCSFQYRLINMGLIFENIHSDKQKLPGAAEEGMEKSIREILEAVYEDICNNYCKFRDTLDEECLCSRIREGESCPLDRLN